MKGSIRQKSKNSWQIVVDVGSDAEGKRQRHFETVRGRKTEADRRLRELLTSLDKGIPLPTGKITVADLLRQWLEAKSDCGPKTLESYQSIVEGHLIPALGHILLAKLQPRDIDGYYKKALQKPLSARSVHYHHRLLKQALKYAVWQEYLGRNPCDRVKPPSPQRKEMRTLDSAEVRLLRDTARGSRLYPLIYTAVSCGLRRNELLALRWRDVDLDECSISVSRSLYKNKGTVEFREPKTSRSRRCISITEKLAAYLKDYKVDRESLNLHLGRLLALDDLVFGGTEGEVIDPHVVSHSFSRIAKRAGLDGLRFHDLRHTFATLALRRGVMPKVVSDALGHASVGFTLDVYAGRIPQQEAMALLNEVLPEG